MAKIVVGQKYVVVNLNGIIGHCFYLDEIITCKLAPSNGRQGMYANKGGTRQTVDTCELKLYQKIKLKAIYD